MLLGPGRISLMPPGEIHDGVSSGGEPYTLKTFRVSANLLRDIAEELTGTSCEPELAGTMIEDPLLAAHLLRLHDALSQSRGASSLAMQTEWLPFLHFLFTQSRTIRPQAARGALSPLSIYYDVETAAD